MLFEAKLAQQKEALQDIKQLADIIASQHGTSFSDGGGGTIVTNSGLVSAPGSANTISLPPRRSSAGIVIALMALLGAAAGGFLYLRNQTLARERAAQAAAAAQEAANQRPAEVEQAKGSLEIKSSPDGCAIWLNGDLRQEVTPAKIEGLPFGRELSLKLTKEGFETYRETISLTEAEPSRTIDAQMRTGSVTVVLKIDPPPMIWLDNKPWKGKGSKIEGLSADEEHKLVLTANGFVPRTITFVAKQGETKVIEERLVRAEGGQAGPVPGGEPKAGGPTAKVRVGSKGGFCNVTINGASHGSTPVEAVVNPGTVRVSCKPSDGASQSQTVRVNAGETARVSFKLD
jgi:serine/threonine-protein kinase